MTGATSVVLLEPTPAAWTSLTVSAAAGAAVLGMSVAVDTAITSEAYPTGELVHVA